MKKQILILSILLSTTTAFSQFGGGSGTEEDPYKLYTKEQVEELADSVIGGNMYTGVHFSLMNDITDSVTKSIGYYHAGSMIAPFDGFFHGQGHNIVLSLPQLNYGEFFERAFIELLDANGYIDSLSVTGRIFCNTGALVRNNCGVIFSCINNMDSIVAYVAPNYPEIEYSYIAGICAYNEGIIINCINNADLYGKEIGGICVYNHGQVLNCINNGSLNCWNESELAVYGGICAYTYDVELTPSIKLTDCRNFGNIYTGFQASYAVGGIIGFAMNYDTVMTCSNYGSISGKLGTNVGGVIGLCIQDCANEFILEKCSNYGNINSSENIGGILGYSIGVKTKDCFNSGEIVGSAYVGGLVGYCESSDTLISCLNIGLCENSAVIDTYLSNIVLQNNYFDKQMVPAISATPNGNFVQQAEGKLTTQLTGTSPELQAMLGNGWSYAEGRYPIPSGLENDSLALVAATPVYLHFESEEAYNHVDSVTKNFTVTTGVSTGSTTVAFDWEDTYGHVSFSDENVTLLSIGVENLIVNLGDYSKNVRINIVDIETSVPDQTIENRITAYPNPAGEFISLNLNGINAERVDVCDITGKLLSTNNLSTEQTQIFTGNLHSGLYLLKVYDGNRNIETLKFIKQ